MKFRDRDILELTQLFEDALSRTQKIDKTRKMRMRKKIRDELFSLLSWELATPIGIMKRWEERLSDVFLIMPYGFKDQIFSLLIDKTMIPKPGKKKGASLRIIYQKRLNKSAES